MLGLSAILVLLLHVWIIISVTRPAEPLASLQPTLMEVSLVAAPQRQTGAVAPLAPPPPPVKQPLPPKKPKAKPPPLKKPTIADNKPDIVQSRPVAETKPIAPALSEPASASVAPSTAVDSSPAKSKPIEAEKFVEANFHANYGINPKPEYPRLARNRGWQGKVLLRVQVGADGASGQVTVYHSSGYETLDESAVAAVERWKFVPAKRGETPVASSVIVPIIFSLND